MKPSGWLTAFWLTTAGMASGVAAESAPGLMQLLRISDAAPRQAEIAATVRRAEGFATQAAVRPNPSVAALTENVGGTRPYDGTGRAETTLQLSQPFELGDKRASRIAVGQAGVEVSRVRSFEARVLYAFELTNAYATAEAADRRTGLIEEEINRAQDDARAVNALVDAGKEAQLRALQAQASLNAVKAELDWARVARADALARLSALVGTVDPYTAITQGLLDRTDLAVNFERLDPLRTPGYRSALGERELAERRVQFERTRAYPDLTVTVGARRLAYDNATALIGGISLPLPLFDRNQGNVNAAQADLDGAEARLRISQDNARAESSIAILRIEAAQVRLDAALLAEHTAAEAYRLAQIGYQSGKSSLLELLSVRRSLGLARGATLDARLSRLQALASLARLSGRNVFGESIQ